MMRRRWTIAVLVAISLALLVPSAAVTLQNSGTDQIDSAVELSPSDTPNGQYAVINDETGEIELRFDAANPHIEGSGPNIGSITPFHHVFTVTNNGSEPGEIWFTIDSDAVTFYRGTDTADSLIGSENAIHLEPSETVSVGVLIDATQSDVENVSEFTIHAEPVETETDSDSSGATSFFASESQPSVSITTLSDTQRSITFENPDAGEDMTAAFDRLVLDRNDGELVLEHLTITPADEDDIELDLSVAEPETDPFADEPGLRPLGHVSVEHRGGTIDSTTFGFAADDSYLTATGIQAEDLEFHRTTGNTSEVLRTADIEQRVSAVAYEVDTEGISNITVVARVPAFRVTQTSLTPTNVTVGENVTVRVTVENQGLAAGNTTLPVTLDGRTVASEDLRLDPNGTAEVELQIQPDEAGEYAVAVANVTVGTLVVSNAPKTTTGDAELSDSGTTTTESGSAGGGIATARTTTESDDGVGTIDTPIDTVEEPAGFQLTDFASLAVGLILLVLLLFLVRRRPRR